jgi:hypothetical protein
MIRHVIVLSCATSPELGSYPCFDKILWQAMTLAVACLSVAKEVALPNMCSFALFQISQLFYAIAMKT